MFGVTRAFPSYLMHGLGQDTSTVQDWINQVMKPIADVVKEYYDIQYQQQYVQAQKVLQAATIPSIAGINPLYLIGGGLLIWYLFKGKGQMKARRRR